MPPTSADPRSELVALCERGLEWRPDLTRALADAGGARPAAVPVRCGILESVPARSAGPIAAALREAVEETGLDPDGIDPLGTLPPMPVPVRNHVVTPVPAWWPRP